MYEMNDQFGTESILQGEVSTTLSEPYPETSTFALDAFHGAMAEACVLALLR
jgi:hypothetical protein